MSTIRQKKLAKNIAENMRAKKPRNKKELLVASGYSEITAKASPNIIMEQKGVVDELEILGFSVQRAKEVLAGILNAPSIYEMVTPENQIRAAQEVFKVFGAYAPDKHMTVNIDIEVSDDIKALADKLNGV